MKDAENGFEKFLSAVSGIIVISQGDDSFSSAKLEDFFKEVLKKKIVIYNIKPNDEKECKTLCAYNHAHGGCPFQPELMEKGLQLINQHCFWTIKNRPLKHYKISFYLSSKHNYDTELDISIYWKLNYLQ